MSRKYVTNFRGESFYSPNEKVHVKEEPRTPSEEDFGNHHNFDQSIENGYCSMRKSLSMSDIASLREDLVKLEFNNKDDMYERYNRKPFGAPQELSKTKFVSMAEAIYHYQRDTPGRFHSTKPQIFRTNSSSKPNLTIPQSPMLRCKARSRPVHIMSLKEKEEMELEEIRKFKLKANPIPKSVLEGSKHLPEVLRKPNTVPEPFKLTELPKKSMQTPDKIQTFKARPAPKHILEKPQIPVKMPIPVTKPVSPKLHYKRGNSADQLKCENKHGNILPKSAANKNVDKDIKLGPVRPEPFSFEKRNEEMKRRKEEWIKKQLEEEKMQAYQFKAQPLPGGVRKQMHKTVKGCSSTTSSENKENRVKFEARPPVVLYKEPFKPVLQTVQLSKPMPFALTTEKRAAEREKFDQLIKVKEEEQEKLRQQREREQEAAEDKIRAELRSKLVHHAKPLPVMAPFVPEKSVIPITVPETPKFVRRMKQNQAI